MGKFDLGEIANMPLEDLVTGCMALMFSANVIIHSVSGWPHLITSLLRAITYLVKTFPLRQDDDHNAAARCTRVKAANSPKIAQEDQEDAPLNDTFLCSMILPFPAKMLCGLQMLLCRGAMMMSGLWPIATLRI